MASQLTIGVTGARGAETLLDGVAARGRSLRPALVAVADLLLAVERRQFQSKGAYAQTPWAALSDATKARKARAGQPAAILVATGRLKDSLTTKGAAGQTLDIQAQRLFLGSDAWYGKFAQQGKGRELRPIIHLRDGDLRVVSRTLTQYLATGTFDRPTPAGG